MPTRAERAKTVLHLEKGRADRARRGGRMKFLPLVPRQSPAAQAPHPAYHRERGTGAVPVRLIANGSDHALPQRRQVRGWRGGWWRRNATGLVFSTPAELTPNRLQSVKGVEGRELMPIGSADAMATTKRFLCQLSRWMPSRISPCIPRWSVPGRSEQGLSARTFLGADSGAGLLDVFGLAGGAETSTLQGTHLPRRLDLYHPRRLYPLGRGDQRRHAALPP